MKSVCVFPDSEKLAEEIARSWLEQARQTINNYGTFSVVLSESGNTHTDFIGIQ